MKRIYLDHNATSPIHADVIEAMATVQREGPLNPASQHRAGRVARRHLEAARLRLSQALGLRLAPPKMEDRLILTSGGTESNNLVVSGVASSAAKRIVVSSIEHPSVIRACEAMASAEFEVARCHVDADGNLDLDHLDALTSAPTSLVSVMFANNETGVIQPIRDVVSLCTSREIPVHADAAQIAGKIDLDFQASGLSALTIAAHKFRGPVGIGALVVRNDLSIYPRLFGGFQQLGLRPGTESVALTVGMAHALELSLTEHLRETERLRDLRDSFELALRKALPMIVVHAEQATRLPHVSCLGFPGCDGQELFMAFDLLGIDCSTGSACASGSAEISPTLLAMGVEKSLAASSLRFSFGCLNETADAQIAADRIIKHFKHLQLEK